jgi:predicted dehydrogenase
MKILIAGFGSIGRRHLNNLRALGESDFVLLRSHNSTLSENDIQGIPVETDITAALSHIPDAVIISNPTSLHLAVAIPAAKAGCSVLMEKPVSHSMERVTELQSALESGGGRLLVGFQYRFHPVLRQVKQWLESGKIGNPVSSRAHWGEYLPDWHPWEDYRKGYSARADLGGGVVHTLSHPFDYQRWFFGDVQNIWAYISSQGGLGIKVEDTAEIGMQFQNGVISSIHLDYIQRQPEHTLKIIGSKGTIDWDNTIGSARLYCADTKNQEEAAVPLGFDRNQLFMDEMRHFLAVVKGQEPPECTLEDGVAALKMAEAVHLSAAGKTMIRFNDHKD